MFGIDPLSDRLVYSKKFLFAFVVSVIALIYFFGRNIDAALPVSNFLLVPIIVAAFEHGYAFSYLLSFLAGLFIFVLMLLERDFKLPYIVSIVPLSLVPLVPGYVNFTYNKLFDEKKSELNKTRISLNEFLVEFGVLKEENAALEARASKILELYEITREMSVPLDIIGTLSVFRERVRGIFKYDRQELILIGAGEQAAAPCVKYEIPFSPTQISKKPASKFDAILVEAVLRQKETIFLKPPLGEAHPFKGYLADAFGSFAALPLLSEGTPIGILTVYGIEEDIEKLFIMAEQLALAIKKVSLYERIQVIAITDGLTQLYARRHILERLEEEISRSNKYKLNLSVIMLDIDHFKQCNDTHGHLVGDILLKEIARLIKEYTRQVDLAGRYGGEEFIIVLPDTDKASAAGVAERIRRSVEKHQFKAYDEVINATVSIGAATFPQDGASVTDLIDRADHALYRAKEEGRNRIFYWP